MKDWVINGEVNGDVKCSGLLLRLILHSHSFSPLASPMPKDKGKSTKPILLPDSHSKPSNKRRVSSYFTEDYFNGENAQGHHLLKKKRRNEKDEEEEAGPNKFRKVSI